jgi:molybdate-binding protein
LASAAQPFTAFCPGIERVGLRRKGGDWINLKQSSGVRRLLEECFSANSESPYYFV